MERVIKLWNGLPREVLKSSSLEVYRHVDMAFGDMV